MIAVHESVLKNECLEYLSPAENPSCDTYFMIDATLGEGGHTEAFLTTYKKLQVMGLDADSVIQERAKERLGSYGNRVSFFNGWFTDFFEYYPKDIPTPDIILFDLGISIFHYQCSGRGFSFKSNEPLDMRLNTNTNKTAADIVNLLNEKDLADLLFNFAEERYSRRIARAICLQRQTVKFVFAKELADCIYSAVPAAYRHGAIHPATKSFQALRIAVNSELERLQQVLDNAFKVLKIGGKMGVISFHSLEDRIVKNFYRNLARYCTCPPEVPICKCGGKKRGKILTTKPVVATDTECKNNPPSRSAKLRVIQKIC